MTDPVEIIKPAGVVQYERTPVGEWEQVVDYPIAQEHPRLGLDYEYDFENRTVSVTCSDPPITAELPLDAAEVFAWACG